MHDFVNNHLFIIKLLVNYFVHERSRCMRVYLQLCNYNYYHKND